MSTSDYETWEFKTIFEGGFEKRDSLKQQVHGFCLQFVVAVTWLQLGSLKV